MAAMWSRRVMLGFGALLLPPARRAMAVAKPADETGASLAGQLLVAAPEMGDPRFQRTVILMVQHDRTRAFGIVINRQVDEVPAAKLLGALGLECMDCTARLRLFAGGPVQPELGFVVHSAEYHGVGTIDIDDRVAVTTDPGILRDIGRNAGPKQILVAFGYAGWGPGQLEGELAQGGWFTVPEEPRLVFDVERSKLWDEVLARRTIPL
jgi:putative transcriptional regulator